MKKSKFFVSLSLFLFLLIFLLSYSLSDKNKIEYTVEYIEEPRVFVTTYGECYHSPHCHYLKNSSIEIGLNQAQEKGYKPCSYCHGSSDSVITIEYIKPMITDNRLTVLGHCLVFSALSALSIYILSVKVFRL